MARLTRSEQQERTRAAVLVAAREEFAEHGFVAARVDRVADRAELTRGAVYSNFAGKRALYLAVLVDDADAALAVVRSPVSPPDSVAAALGSFARVWLERLPLMGDSPGSGHLALRSVSGVLGDGPGRAALGELVRLEGLLLALALETLEPHRGRRARLAGLVLTTLFGAAALAQDAPGASDPFDVARACEHLAELSLPEDAEPAHLPHVAPARSVEAAWEPPRGLVDQVSERAVDVAEDGVLAVLGARRLSAAAEAVRWARRRDTVTVVVVTDDPAEIGRLVRFRVVDLIGCLRRAVGTAALPRLRVVLDDAGAVPAALGLGPVDDRTESAVRVRDGVLVARADGPGAGYAAACASPG